MTILTDRWYKLRPHKMQARSMRSEARFNINHSGRRSGKTEISGKRRVINKALIGNEDCNWRGFVAAPTRNQAKKIYWQDLKELSPPALLSRKPDESNLIIFYVNGSQLHVLGMDRPERVEGPPWDHGVLDEYGNMKPQTWSAHVRPALSDRRGSCDFIGVPEGRNHYWDLVQSAKQSIRIAKAVGKKPSWAVYHWRSDEIIDPEEIEAARSEMDQLVFDQEFGGEFVSFSGAVYYCYRENLHSGRYIQCYNKKLPLVLCFDFNVSPGVAVVLQELGADVFDISPGKTITTVLREIYIPRNSNTQRICRKIIELYGETHEGLVICYGDSTGGAQGTAKVTGSDWDIIRRMFLPYFKERLFFNVPKHNPRERQRVNSVNSRLLSISGDVRMVVDGAHAPNLLKDFDGVRVIEGTAGEIDKKRDPLLTHLSDALGYYVYREWPVGKYYTKEDILEIMADHNKQEIDKQVFLRAA